MEGDISIIFGNYGLTITKDKKDVDLVTLIQDYSTNYKEYLYASALVLDELEKKRKVRFGCLGLCGRSSTVLLITLSVLSIANGIPPSRIYMAYREYLKQYANKFEPKECPETEFQRMLASSAIAVAETLSPSFPMGLLSASRAVFSGVAIVMEPIGIEGSSTNAFHSVFGKVNYDVAVGAEANIIRNLVPSIMERLKRINKELINKIEQRAQF